MTKKNGMELRKEKAVSNKSDKRTQGYELEGKRLPLTEFGSTGKGKRDGDPLFQKRAPVWGKPSGRGIIASITGWQH